MALWREITSIQEWQDIRERSEHNPVLLLKHSTQCPISMHAFNEFQSYIENYPDQMEYALVKVIESRNVSNQIADDLGIPHASPQIFLIKDRSPQWHTSHGSITSEQIAAAFASPS